MKKIIILMMLFAPLAVMAQKFGHVDTQSIMQTLPEIAKVNGELQAIAQQYENDLKAMQEELQRKSDEYEKAKATMAPTKQKETETSLAEMYQKIQQTYAQNQQEMQKKSSELMQPIVAKVKAAIDAVGKAGNYTYIFEEGAAVYAGTNVVDVTKEVQAKIK